MPLVRPTTALVGYEGLTAYAGDIHNHCAISYGHGPIEDAYANARLQLDFASVTGHANWHDMPEDPPHVAAYHRMGFDRLRRAWGAVQDLTEAVHADGEFVSFLSFEWHSLTYGDHCVYYRSGRGPLTPASATHLADLRDQLRAHTAQGLPAMMLPHHIGYRRGWRGVNWSTFTTELSPVIEVVSMHGCGESDQAPRPYLHTMGPRDVGSTAFAGLRAGHRFGLIGSTDHHSAHPGSHGYGAAMVWAKELTREGIWSAITSRRTYAITGDRIMLATTLNGRPMGEEVHAPGPREISVAVAGAGAVDYVEVVRCGEVVARSTPSTPTNPSENFVGVLSVGLGWGELGVPVEWDVEVEVQGGRIDAVEPRLHGYDIVAPSDKEPDSFAFSRWTQTGPQTVRLWTSTCGNPTVTTDATQRLALHVTGDLATQLVVRVDGRESRHTVAELLNGPQVSYRGGFLSGAIVVDRAEPDSALRVEFDHVDEGTGADQDWYTVRVRQRNDQWAWSSPTWALRHQR